MLAPYKNWLLIPLLYLSLLLAATPVQAGLFGQSLQCRIVLGGLEPLEVSEAKNQKIIDSQRTPEEKVHALFQRLPKKLRKEAAFNLAVYLAKHSPRADALSLATHLYVGEQRGKKSFNLSKDQVRRGQYQSNIKTDYLEYSLRMHPRLNDLMRFFEIPDAEAGYADFLKQRGEIEAQLVHLEPMQAQVVVRFVIDELIRTKNKTVNPYAYALLLKVANSLTGDKLSRSLAKGLSAAYNSEALLAKTSLADRQMRIAVRDLLDPSAGRLLKERVYTAIHKSLSVALPEKSLLRSMRNFFISTLSLINVLDLWDHESFEFARYEAYKDYKRATPMEDRIHLSDWTGYTMFDFYHLQFGTLGIFVSTYTLKGLYYFIYDFRDPHPGGYLRDETDFELSEFNNDLQKQTDSVLQILGARVPAPPPPPPSVAPTVPPTLASGLAPLPGPSLPADPSMASTSLEVLPDPHAGEVSIEGGLPSDPVESPLKLQESGNYALPFPLEKVRAKGVRRRYTEEIPSRWMPLTSEQEQANRSFFNYFNEVKLHLLERDTLIEHLQLGYLLKEPVNIQMLGEAGVAKTQVATKIMGRMTDEHGQSSFFRQQMGVNTTIGELIGTVKQSGLKEDRIIRAAERGLPGFENSFLDEYYNAPADTRHDLLTLQAEGLITMGGETYKSKSRMTLYASNKYPDQVFFDAGNDTPRAEMDRMLFTHIVSPTFEYDENMLDLEQLRQAPLKASLTFQEIDQLRGLADRIEIPRYYLAKTKLVINRLRQNEIKREHDSKIEWLRRDHHGEVNLTPPTYMARVLSPRSEKRAYQLLKVFALADWLAAKANGAMVSPEPEITEVHFARLVEFFVYNGPSDEHIERILREYPKGSIPHQQFLNLRQRRQEFFELLAVTAGDLSMEQPMKELHQFLEALNIGAGGLEFAVLKLDAKHRLNDRNAPVVNALIKWHKQLGERIAAKDKIKEVTTSDVALLQAHDLGGRLIHKLMEPRKR